MAEGSYKKAYVRCPFYQRDDVKSRRISCEGIVEKSSISLTYRRREDYIKQIDVFCCDRYINCEVYGMLMKKYEE